MAKGALYWRHKDERGKWTYTNVRDMPEYILRDIIADYGLGGK